LHRSLWSVSEDHEDLTDQVIDEWVARMSDHDLKRIDLTLPREFVSAIEDSILIHEEVQGLSRFHPVRRMPISNSARFLLLQETFRTRSLFLSREDTFLALPKESLSQKLAQLLLACKTRNFLHFESLWTQFQPELADSPLYWHMGASVAGRRMKLNTARSRSLKSVKSGRYGLKNWLFLGKAALLTGHWRTFQWAAEEVAAKQKRIERRVKNYAKFV
jgi:hypothetical protein